jgi:hypothetical protein
MPLLDEASAAALGGEVADVKWIGRVCCFQIYACETLRDGERAVQWSNRIKEFSRRWQFRSLLAVCRTEHAAVLTWLGNLAEAEAELAAAMDELGEVRHGLMTEAVVRLGELRRRQGRLAEAARLFGSAEFHPLARVGSRRPRSIEVMPSLRWRSPNDCCGGSPTPID